MHQQIIMNASYRLALIIHVGTGAFTTKSQLLNDTSLRLGMYVGMYVCMYVFMYVCAYVVYMLVCMSVCMYVCMYVVCM